MSLNNSIITQSIGIPYQQYVTSSAGHTLISSSTYFNDTSDNIPRYKDASGNIYDAIISSSYALTASHALNSGGGGDAFPFTGDAQITGSLVISASNNTSESLSIQGSGSTIFSIQGSQGQLFSVTDDLLDEVFSVADISGDTLLSVSGSGLVTIPVGDLTGSATATASYGAFKGDGSQLTNLPASDPFPFTGDAQITGSLEITGSITTFIQGQRNLFLPSNGDIVIGKSATNATGYNDVVIGRDAAGANGYGVTIGRLSKSNQYSVVIGDNANNSGTYGNGTNNVAVGAYARAKTGAVSMGFRAYAEDNSNAIGRSAQGTGLNSTVINSTGNSVTPTKNNAFGVYLHGTQANFEIEATGSSLLTGSSFTIEKSGSTLFEVIGSEGTIFSLEDDLDGTLFTVNDRSGIPMFEVSASGRIVAEEGESIIRSQRPMVTHTADFSITSSLDFAGKYHIVGGDLTCSINTSSIVPAGAEFEFFQTSSAGNFLYTTASHVDLIVKNDNLNLAGRGSGATLKYIGGSTFHLVGDLT